MKLSYKWLSSYLDLSLSPEETAEKLTLLGLEVEEIETIGSSLDGVVVGQVLSCVSHPNADTLSLCSVDIGEDIPVSIVCGAPNVAKGQFVPVATVGTTLPVELPNGKPLKIKKSKIRGEVSQGMICALDELGIGSDHSGILVLEGEPQPGIPFSEVWDLDTDVVLEIGLTPNRPDAACHLGSARDLAAVLKQPLIKPESSTVLQKGSLGETLSIHINDTDKCHRYVGILIKDVTIKESPEWVQQRLRAIGLRPRNNVVDATNFVLHELGQPLHAFDYSFIRSKKIVVRSFEEVVPFKTLDEVDRTVPKGSLFICDDSTPVGIAGVMGGMNSEINDQTTDVLLESAWFEPSSIRKTAKQLALSTDASYRFERGVDPNITLTAALRCAELIEEWSGGSIHPIYIDEHPIKTDPIHVQLRASYVNGVLGTQLSLTEIAEWLTGLEMNVQKISDDVLEVIVPTFRPDIEREIDLVEEVGRLFDYNNIPSPTTTKFHTPSPFPFHEQFLSSVKRQLLRLGCSEIYTNPLLPEKYNVDHFDPESLVETLNPVSKDQVILRDTLTYGFLKTVQHNFNRNNTSISFFEIGQVFKRSNDGTYIDGYDEHTSLGIGIAGKRFQEHWNQKEVSYSIHDLLAIVHTWMNMLGLENKIVRTVTEDGRLQFTLGNHSLGYLRSVSPKEIKSMDLPKECFVAEFNLSTLESIVQSSRKDKIKPISKYPSTDFDLALVVDKDVKGQELMGEITKAAGNLLDKVTTFDVFEGGSLPENKKSIAFRLTFQHSNKTLTQNDIDPIVKKILKRLHNLYKAELRS